VQKVEEDQAKCLFGADFFVYFFSHWNLCDVLELMTSLLVDKRLAFGVLKKFFVLFFHTISLSNRQLGFSDRPFPHFSSTPTLN